jgi:hypothetical protein
VETPAVFLLAFLIVLVWGGLGPIMKFSNAWQLIINTGNQHRHVPGRISDPVRAELGHSRNSAQA